MGEHVVLKADVTAMQWLQKKGLLSIVRLQICVFRLLTSASVVALISGEGLLFTMISNVPFEGTSLCAAELALLIFFKFSPLCVFKCVFK